MVSRLLHLCVAIAVLFALVGCQHRHSRHPQPGVAGPIHTAASGGDQLPTAARDEYGQLKSRVDHLDSELRAASTVPAGSGGADTAGLTNSGTPTAGTESAGRFAAPVTDPAGNGPADLAQPTTDHPTDHPQDHPNDHPAKPTDQPTDPAQPSEQPVEAAGTTDPTTAAAQPIREDPESRRRRLEEETRRIREVLDQMNGKSGK